MEQVKLNIGAGSTVIEGFTPIDRKLGSEAYPLAYPDASVDEIRASHILEHFSFGDAQLALSDWVRAMKPGARIRLAVPDVVKVIEAGKSHPTEWMFQLMGGQIDANDFHRSCWTENGLRDLMRACGLTDIRPWISENTDCASLPISLNLEGIKPLTPVMAVKVAAVLSVPRFGPTEPASINFSALGCFRIPLHQTSGVYWGQCLQRTFNTLVANGTEWILTFDFDSLFTARDLDILMGELAANPQIDAIAALQPRRGRAEPLLSVDHPETIEVTGAPIKVCSAHFGLTLIRIDSLKKVPKPWFKGEPCPDGEWCDNRLDDDIWFWHQWRLAGNTVYVSTNCRIGHLESRVAQYERDMTVSHYYVPEWRTMKAGQPGNNGQCELNSPKDGECTCKGKSPIWAEGSQPNSLSEGSSSGQKKGNVQSTTPEQWPQYMPVGRKLTTQDSPSAPN